MQKNLIITLLFSIFIALFAILNASAVPINFIFAVVDVSVALVILISASIGAIILYSMGAISKLKARKAIKEKDKMIETLNQELNELKLVKANMEVEMMHSKEQPTQYNTPTIDQEEDIHE